MTVHHRSNSSTCSRQTPLVANGLYNMDMLQGDTYLSSNSATTLSTPATPTPTLLPVITMLPTRNDTTMTPPSLTLPDTEYSSQSYCEFMYHTGFQQGRFSDISVSFPVQGRIYALHRIVMVRSPMLYRELMAPSTANGYHGNLLHISIPGSSEALHIALGHLYRPLSMHDIEYLMVNTQSHQPPIQHICDLIQIADALELPLLHQQLIQIMQQHLNQDTIVAWMNELRRRHAFLSSQSDNKISAKWMRTLDEIIVHFLIHTLPCQLLQIHGNNTNHWRNGFEEEQEYDDDSATETLLFLGTIPVNMIQESNKCMTLSSNKTGIYDELIHMYARTPLLYLKRCLEYKNLLSKSVLWRYTFAKRVLYERECKQSRRPATKSHGLAVVLEFDNSSSSSKNTKDDSSSISIRIMMQQ